MRIATSNLGTVTDLIRGERWSPEELGSRIGEGLRTLDSVGVRPRRNVVIAHGGTPSFFADLFATWAAGACAVCINPRISAGELDNILELVRPAAILVDDQGSLPASTASVPVVCASDSAVQAQPGLGEIRGSELDDPALVLFTSGTSGRPKGVVHTFRSLLARVALNRAYIGIETLRRTLCVLPTHFGHGLIGNCLTPLLSGADLLLAVEDGISGASRLGSLLETHEPTFMSSVPTFWKLVSKVSVAPSRSSLRQVSIGSAPLPAALWTEVMNWTGCNNVVNMYGITETANWIAGISAAQHAPSDGAVGRMWGGSVAVLDEAGAIAGSGNGEILVQTPSLMRGYFARDDLTQEALRDGWYHTGDAGHVDEHGSITLIGRRKSEINRGGYKIHPEEIDALVERHPCVAEACTFGVPDDLSGEMVAIAVVLAEQASQTSQTLREWCAERIRLESVPERWFFLDEIPKSDRGKVNRDNVRTVCLERSRARS